ncbi:hypothetical protein BU17DRAFT_66884 [Hysterangium stoloniferum]|nr:hypothetical protein BU17DRAFT_66884 [Hysterangium stoloniferum]
MVVSTTTAGVPSSSTLSRPSILRTKSSSDVSIASNDPKTYNITFAPLPVIEPRKRRSNRPIGLAGRAEMLRKSRKHFIVPENTCEEEEEYVSQRNDDDIPLPDIGKLVKGLWRSISRGAGDKNSREAPHDSSLRCQHGGCTATQHEGDDEEKESEGNVWMEQVTWSPKLGFAAASFSLHDPIKNTQGTTSSTGTFLEKLEGMKDGEGGRTRDSDEHDLDVRADTAIAVAVA